MPAIKIKSTDPESQGPYVIIEAEDFDAAKHEHYVESDLPAVDTPVDIPEGWADLHWKTRVGIARKIVGGDEEITSDKANEIITAEVERRAAQPQA